MPIVEMYLNEPVSSHYKHTNLLEHQTVFVIMFGLFAMQMPCPCTPHYLLVVQLMRKRQNISLEKAEMLLSLNHVVSGVLTK